MADCLRVLTENVAKLSGGMYMPHRLSEITGDTKKPVEDERSGDEIAKEVINKMGLALGGGE